MKRHDRWLGWKGRSVPRGMPYPLRCEHGPRQDTPTMPTAETWPIHVPDAAPGDADEP